MFTNIVLLLILVTLFFAVIFILKRNKKTIDIQIAVFDKMYGFLQKKLYSIPTDMGRTEFDVKIKEYKKVTYSDMLYDISELKPKNYYSSQFLTVIGWK
jgi:hypothetical protein